MADLTPTPAHRAARNAASIALADTGAGPSTIRLYTAQGGTLLAVRHLQKPCGQITANRIELLPAETPDLATATGGAAWAQWCDGTGAPIAGGHVTDAQGNYTDAQGDLVAHPAGLGVWILASTDEQPGTKVHAGGVVQLDSVLIG